MTQKYTVKIDGAGNPQIEAEGFVGGACTLATKAVTDALSSDGAETEVEHKDEFHQEEEEGISQTL